MLKQRIFIALPLSEEFQLKLETVLREKRERLRIRWLPRENWHLTLLPPQFWGSQELNLAQEKLREEVKKKVFSLTAEKIILAPPQREKRMIWLVFKNTPEFFELQQEIRKILLLNGFSLEEERHSEKIIHLTLARFNPQQGKNLTWEPLDFSESFLAERFELWQSFLKPEGAEYRSLASFELL